MSKGTVSKVMIAFEKERKSSSAKHKSGQKSNLSESHCRTFHQIVKKDRRTTALKITSELNEHLENPVYTKPVR